MRQPTGATTDGTVRVSRKNLVDDAGGCGLKRFEACAGQSVGDGDEPVAVKQLGRSVDLVRGDYLDIWDAVLFLEPLSQRLHSRIIRGSVPACTGRVSANQVPVLRGGLNLNVRFRRVKAERIVVCLAGNGCDVQGPSVEAVRRDVGEPPSLTVISSHPLRFTRSRPPLARPDSPAG